MQTLNGLGIVNELRKSINYLGNVVTQPILENHFISGTRSCRLLNIKKTREDQETHWHPLVVCKEAHG